MATGILNVAHMMRKALNTLDYRLMDHGERVAYIVYRMCESTGKYSTEQLTKICYLSMFHDIGAYQTEILDPLDNVSSSFGFEVLNTHTHAIYSYIFFREHEFFSEYADALLYHHFVQEKLELTDCENKDLASAMFLADKLDILFLHKRATTPQAMLNALQNSVFKREYVELLEKLEEEDGVLSDIMNGAYLDKLMTFLTQSHMYDEHLNNIVHMIPHAIDFRSEHTVTHTAATVEISMILADLFNFSEEEKSDVYLGSLLHDIGKIATSVLILEKAGRLTDVEFNIMKDHVSLTEYILRGCMRENIVNIASRHHEKLDGSGYPLGLTEADLSSAERIVAVADILSALLGRRSYKDPFPREKVIGIMRDMADKNHICSACVDVAEANYGLIDASVEKISDDAMLRYIRVKRSAHDLHEKLAKY